MDVTQVAFPSPSHIFREFRKSDEAKIYSDWLRSFRHSEFGRTVATGVYFREHHALIERLLKRSHVAIVCDNLDPSIVIGWGCGERLGDVPIVHFAWVDRLAQRNGIGLAILQALGVQPPAMWLYTHSTDDTRHWRKHGGIHDPYVLMRPSNG